MLEAAIERGLPVPSWAASEPELLPGDEFYIEAFFELSSCRSLGWGVGPIPWRDIVQYGRFYELEPDVLRMFIRVIRAMDTVYLEWEAKRKPKKDG